MLNKHFIKTLFTFVIIIACGAVITVVVNFIENSKAGTEAETSGFDRD